ncbi:MAG: hypothetical protein K0A99_09350, partial [Desulfoarculaceae bacterium]|nr:hypothetical protein [Desulfoarculaceae bacterium]
ETPNYLVTAAYSSTPHSSKFARLAFDAFYLAIPEIEFLRNHQYSSLLWLAFHFLNYRHFISFPEICLGADGQPSGPPMSL